MYPPQNIHDAVSQYEDFAFAIICTFWIYEWMEERIKKALAKHRGEKPDTMEGAVSLLKETVALLKEKQ
jgi:hypothetical protein